MSVYKNVNFYCYLCLLFLLISPAVQAINFKVTTAKINKIGNGYVLNAEIKYPLTHRVKEALDNGVPVTFTQEIELIHSTSLIAEYFQWHRTLWTSELRYELRYHALTEQYVLIALDTKHQRNFPSLDGALFALGKIASLALPPEHINEPDSLSVRLRSGLDLHALPTPMRPGALLSSKWQLTSPWVTAIWQ